MMRFHVFCLIPLIMVTTTCVGDELAQQDARVPQLPARIPAEWLSASEHPRVFCTVEQMKTLRVSPTTWHVKHLEKQRAFTERFVGLSEEQLRTLIPPPNSLFTLGLGLNLDPVHQQKMHWAGWDRPHTMLDIDGVAYPNEKWPDQGQGIKDPSNGKTYYFLAQSNGLITKAMDEQILPAMAEVWALGSSQAHARAAAVLLDAIAAVYPTTRTGPIDYPTDKEDLDRGGRLNWSYYQTAIGLVNYSYVIDLIASSGELDGPSYFSKGQSIREHLIRNLLWDGGGYCYDFATRGFAMHNGQVDYERGAAVVGVMLNMPAFAEPLLTGPASFFKMLDNNIDPAGFYYESSIAYEDWARILYLSCADLIEAMHRMGWKDAPDPYQDPSFRKFLGDSFNRAEVGGHIPMTGDSGPDWAAVDPLRRYPDDPRCYNDQYLDSQILSAWTRLAHDVDGDAAAQLLRTVYGERPISPPDARSLLFTVTPDVIQRVVQSNPDPDLFETVSTFYGVKGLALLRGGRGSSRHGAQLFFGPLCNHAQHESLTWTFFDDGAEWSNDPGYYNTHFRMGFTTQTVAHQAMVVDQQSIDPVSGTGQLLAWHSDEQVQWAMASHPEAYSKTGVTRYERLIAQVQKTPRGELGYWLDIGRVEGGNVRDDSFHARMKQMRANVSFSATTMPAMFGDVDLGRQILPDCSLKNHQDKSFYWAAPGDGYGFLGNPREADMSSAAAVRVVLTEPIEAKVVRPIDDRVMIVDFAGAAGRKMIVANGPEMADQPSVPYMICRDTVSGASTFAKVIRLADDETGDPIATFESLHVRTESNTDPSARSATCGAWCVTWKDGRRDLWIVGEPGRSVTATGSNLPSVRTNGRITLIRLDSENGVMDVIASEASRVVVEGGVELVGHDKLTGTVAGIDLRAQPPALRIRWDAKPPVTVTSGALMRGQSESGSPSNWEIRSIDADGVVLQGAKLSLGRTSLDPVADQANWYHMVTSVSQFIGIRQDANAPYAIGRAVYADGKYVARISEISQDAKRVRLAPVPGKRIPGGCFEALIMAIGPGDAVSVPLELGSSATQTSDQK